MYLKQIRVMIKLKEETEKNRVKVNYLLQASGTLNVDLLVHYATVWKSEGFISFDTVNFLN